MARFGSIRARSGRFESIRYGSVREAGCTPRPRGGARRGREGTRCSERKCERRIVTSRYRGDVNRGGKGDATSCITKVSSTYRYSQMPPSTRPSEIQVAASERTCSLQVRTNQVHCYSRAGLVRSVSLHAVRSVMRDAEGRSFTQRRDENSRTNE